MSTIYGPTPGSGISYPNPVPQHWDAIDGTYVTAGQHIYTHPGPAFTTNGPVSIGVTANPFSDMQFLRIGSPTTKLTIPQMSQLMSSHQFIPMDNSSFCLYCYALDLYRSRSEHDFVIREE